MSGLARGTVGPVAEGRQSNNRSYQHEKHDEFGISDDEGSHYGCHDVTLIVPAEQLLRTFIAGTGKCPVRW